VRKTSRIAKASSTLFVLHISTIALIFALIASYVVYLFRTNHVPKDRKALWAVVLFMGGIFAMPVFWFIYVWKPLRMSRLAEQSVQSDRREEAAQG
jgi:type VI protein secretion system component VasK